MIKQQPKITAPREINVNCADTLTAQNGVKLHKIDCTEDEVMRMSFVFKAGTRMQTKAFTASTTANLLSEGTKDFTAHELAEKLDFYGSYFDVSLDRDYVVITFCSLTKFFSQTLEVARQMLLYPTFPQGELETYCSKRQQRLLVEQSKTSFQARTLFSEALFGKEHPYGISFDASEYLNITRDDITTIYDTLYIAENCFAVCSGNISDEIESNILNLCGDIPNGKTKVHIEFPTPHTTPTVFKQHDGAVQSAIRIGTLLFPRSHPDFIAMQMLSTILGGYFGSRLVHNLREERGYTYGIFSGVVNLDYDGYLAIATEVSSESTKDAITQIYHEMNRLIVEKVSEEELEMVKNILVGEVMRILDASFGIADVTIENIQNGSDNNYLNKMLDEVFTITPERIQEVAVKHLDPNKFTTTVVGSVNPF